MVYHIYRICKKEYMKAVILYTCILCIYMYCILKIFVSVKASSQHWWPGIDESLLPNKPTLGRINKLIKYKLCGSIN